MELFVSDVHVERMSGWCREGNFSLCPLQAGFQLGSVKGTCELVRQVQQTAARPLSMGNDGLAAAGSNNEGTKSQQDLDARGHPEKHLTAAWIWCLLNDQNLALWKRSLSSMNLGNFTLFE